MLSNKKRLDSVKGKRSDGKLESSMDIILKRIIETDEISREKVQEKKQRLISIDTEITEMKNSIDEELYERSKKNIAKQTETAEIKLKKEIARIDSVYAEAEARLRSTFEKDRNKQIDKILKNITE